MCIRDSKYIIPYGLYRCEGYISANLARKTTGFSEEDLDLLWQAILNMFENDLSAARGKMAVRELIIFKMCIRDRCWMFQPRTAGRCGDDFTGADRVLPGLVSSGEDRRPGVEPGQGDVRPVYWGRWRPGTGHRHPDRAGSGEKRCV